jgi:hypothetical protein
MDELDLLLKDLANAPLPEESVARVAPRVRAALRRRAVTRYCLAAAAMLATVVFAWPEPEFIPPPQMPDFRIAAPDFALSIAPPPVPSQSRVAKPRPRVVDGDKLQLASTDPNVVIYWSL